MYDYDCNTCNFCLFTSVLLTLPCSLYFSILSFVDEAIARGIDLGQFWPDAFLLATGDWYEYHVSIYPLYV